jgi:hypothetical protein
MINDERNSTIMRAIQHVPNIYQTRNFKITHLLLDGQFETLSNTINGHGLTANICSQD